MKKNIERAETMVKSISERIEKAKEQKPKRQGLGEAERIFRPDPRDFTLAEGARVLCVNGEYVISVP